MRELSCFHSTKSRNTSPLQAYSSVLFLQWVASLQNLEMGPLCSYDGFSLCAWYCLLTSSRLIILLVTSQSWGDHQVSSHSLNLNPLSPWEDSDSLDLSPNSFNWKQFFVFFSGGICSYLRGKYFQKCLYPWEVYPLLFFSQSCIWDPLRCLLCEPGSILLLMP